MKIHLQFFLSYELTRNEQITSMNLTFSAKLERMTQWPQIMLLLH